MNFIKRHEPKNFSELVFHDQNVAEIIADYAMGVRDKHLLLYGERGTGKSSAAWMILKSCIGDHAGTAYGEVINGSTYSADNWEMLNTDWHFQKNNGTKRGYTVIDEIDSLSLKMREKLRAKIDQTDYGTIIATTNYLHKLEEPLKDRFRLIHVKQPTAKNWTQRAVKILEAEGINTSAEHASIVLNGFDDSARKCLEWLEDYILKQRRLEAQEAQGLHQQGSSSTSRVLINGRSLSQKLEK